MKRGIMTDLNTPVTTAAPLYLLTDFAIDDLREIAGCGATDDGEIRASLGEREDSGEIGANACTPRAVSAGQPVRGLRHTRLPAKRASEPRKSAGTFWPTIRKSASIYLS